MMSLRRSNASQKRGAKTLVNLALRDGIKSLTGPVKNRKTFQTRSVDLGPCRIANLDNVAEGPRRGRSESFR
jgi:hypothetical protein